MKESLLNLTRATILATAVATTTGFAALANIPTQEKTKPQILGSKQLPGEFGKIWETYTIGVDNPVNFSIDGLEYAANRIFVNEKFIAPGKDKKFVIVNFAVSNPNSKERTMGNISGGGISMTLITATGDNYETTAIYNYNSSKDLLGMRLKPDQKIGAFTFFEIDANAKAGKLMVEARDNSNPRAAVIRYSLDKAVTPLPEWCRMASNEYKVATTAKTGKPGFWYPFKQVDIVTNTMSVANGAAIVEAYVRPHANDTNIGMMGEFAYLECQSGRVIKASPMLMTPSLEASLTKLGDRMTPTQTKIVFKLSAGDKPAGFYFDESLGRKIAFAWDESLKPVAPRNFKEVVLAGPQMPN